MGSLTVACHIRNVISNAMRICGLPSAKAHHEQLEPNDGAFTLVSMKCWLKTAICFIVKLPQLFMCCYLLWLGSRGLLATLGFEDLLLNAMALEFILNLAQLLYLTLIPYRMKLTVQRTSLPQAQHGNGMALLVFALSLAWVVGYMFWQQVLPEY